MYACAEPDFMDLEGSSPRAGRPARKVQKVHQGVPVSLLVARCLHCGVPTNGIDSLILSSSLCLNV